MARLLLLVAALEMLGCQPVPLERRTDAGTSDAGTAPGTDAPTGDLDAPGSDASERDAPAGAPDDAVVATSRIPTLYACDATGTIHLDMTNAGSSTWAPGEVALVALDPADAFTATRRFELGAPVAPGGTASFDVPTLAPSMGGAYETAWSMARGPAPFGAVARAAVAVNCAGVDSIDVGAAVLHTSPAGVAGWPITTSITALDIATTGGPGSGGIVPSFSKKEGPERWPDVPFLGGTDTIQFTLWLAFRIDGVWHLAGAQQYWYEPALRMCGVPSGWSTNLFYDPGRWAEMSGYPIATGEIIGVLVASGDHRSRTDEAGSSLLERSALVLFPFPGDTDLTYSF